MHASASNVALDERLPWAEASALTQFRTVPTVEVKRVVQDAAIPKLSFGPFQLFPTQFLLLEDERPVSLGSRALEILIALLERRGELVRKQDLMARVWPDVFVEPANLTVHMSALRRTLRDGQSGNRFIINIRGRGYCFVASVGVSEQAI